MSGMAYEAPTMPGRVATFATWSSDLSARASGSSDRDAKITPGTRIGSCRSIRNRYGDSSTSSMRHGYPATGRLHHAGVRVSVVGGADRVRLRAVGLDPSAGHGRPHPVVVRL